MKSKLLLQQNPDLAGSIASTLCMIHCIVTPFLFVAQTMHVTCGSIGPWWWHGLDFLFLIIGLFAIRKTQLTTSLLWIPSAMYLSWALLTLLILNNRMSFMTLSGMLIYIPACGLICLHIYNLKYCQCNDDECCV